MPRYRQIGREKVVIAGVCKGSGMIGPRLMPPQATMLAYLATDVVAPGPLLRKLMWSACDRSFNAVTVDDHASTNDTACLLASGGSGVKLDTASAKENTRRRWMKSANRWRTKSPPMAKVPPRL